MAILAMTVGIVIVKLGWAWEMGLDVLRTGHMLAADWAAHRRDKQAGEVTPAQHAGFNIVRRYARQ